MESLLDIVQGTVPETLRASKYNWQIVQPNYPDYKDVWDQLREYGETRGVKRVVRINQDTFVELGFGFCLKEIVEGVEFNDGTMVVCAMVDEFLDTFTTTVEVRYFILTPKLDNQL